MSFAAQDLHDLTEALRLHPEWRDEVRRLVLTEEVLRLPALVAELAAAGARTEAALESLSQRVEELTAAQQRTEQQVWELAAAQQRTEQQVRELAAAQQRTEEKLERLIVRIDELTAAQRRTEQRVGELADAQTRTEQRVDELTSAQQRTEEKLERLTVRVGELADAQVRTEAGLAELVAVVRGVVDRLGRVEGDLLEFNYARKAGSYFGRLIRRARVVTFQDLEDELRATLADVEVDEVLDLDLMVGGRLLAVDPPQDVLLAVEVSVTVDRGDVDRASRRAEALRRVVPLVIPVVAGKDATLGVEDHARELGVTILYDGKVRLWPDSVARWTESPA